METVIIAEDMLEVVACEECGSDNVLTAPDSCEDCKKWRDLLGW